MVLKKLGGGRSFERVFKVVANSSYFYRPHAQIVAFADKKFLFRDVALVLFFALYDIDPDHLCLGWKYTLRIAGHCSWFFWIRKIDWILKVVYQPSLAEQH